MKILILNTFDTKGGAARAAYRLHKGLQHIGVDSQMLVQAKFGDDYTIIGPQSILGKGLGFVRPYLDTIPARFHSKWNKILFSTAFLPDNISNKVAKLDADVINLHWITGGFLRVETLKRFDKPLVWTLHDSWAFTGGCHIPFDCKRYTDSCGGCSTIGSSRNYDLSRRIWQRKQKAWRDLNITVVAPSHWLADCARSSSLFHEYRVEIIPNGLDLQLYKSRDKLIARDLFALPQEKKLILFGAMDSTSDRNKGFHFLQPALQNLATAGWTEPAELIIFGASEPAEPQNFGLKTHYLGYLHDDVSLAVLYAAADVMVVPSIQEAFGQTASEAMACGTPVVAFGATGLLDIVDHKRTGYLAQPFDAEDLAKGIAWVIEDEERWQVLSHQSRQKVEEEFAIESVAQRYAELYKEVLER
jgi:glycosyltransferase involved in cell wall biosynthesis